MATLTLTDATLWIAEHDASGDANQLSLVASKDARDATNFASGGSRERRKGLGDTSLTASAFAQWGDNQIDPAVFSNLGASALPVTVTAEGGGGDIAYFFQSVESSMVEGLQIGEIGEINVSAESDSGSPLVRGFLSGAKSSRSSSGNGQNSQLGAVGATQSLYSVVHVFSTTGSPTLDITVESDTDSGFVGSTTRITHTQFTAAGYEWSSAAGAISDTYYRAEWTIGGTGSITFGVAIGIA